MSSTYHATVTRGQKAWLVTVVELRRTVESRHLRDAETIARDLVAAVTGVEPDAVDLTVLVDLPGDAHRLVGEAARLHAEATAMQARAAEHLAEAARTLVGAGLPLRDVGTVIGVSHQRVQQLVTTG